MPSGIDPASIPEVPGCLDLAATYKVKVITIAVTGDKGAVDTQALQKKIRSLTNRGVPGSVVSVLDSADLDRMDPELATTNAEKAKRLQLSPGACGENCAVLIGRHLGFEYVITGTLAPEADGYRLHFVLWSTRGNGGQVKGIDVRGPDNATLEAALDHAALELYEPINRRVRLEYELALQRRGDGITAATDGYVKENDRRTISRRTGWIILAAGGAVTALSGVGVYLGLDKSHDIQNGRLQTPQEVLEASANVRTINTATRIVAAIGAATVITGLGFVVFNLDKSQPWMGVQGKF